MTPLTAAERQAMRERHAPIQFKGWPRFECRECHTDTPCQTVRLLDALDATEKERDEARQLALAVLSTLTEKGHPGRPCVRSGWLNVETVAAWRNNLLPQPDAPAATSRPLATTSWLTGTATVAGFCVKCGTTKVRCAAELNTTGDYCCAECGHGGAA